MSLLLDDGADLPRTGIEVGAVGVSGDVGLRQCLDALRRRLRAEAGRERGALEIARVCPACGPGDHGAPHLRWADDAAHTAAEQDEPRPAVSGRRRRTVTGRRLPSISVSRTRGPAAVTVLAWCDPAWRIGVDVEDLGSPATRRAFLPGADGSAQIDAVAFAPDERAALAGLRGEDAARARAERWCLKEAVVKVRGTGFTGDPADVSPRAGESTGTLRPVGVPPDLRGEGRPVALRVRGLPLGVVGAVAWTRER